ncbi:YihY/virulence factor BrkB family protein [Streptococcus hyovaginalis]|uniref:YihY/virulence factor BrkB family protein n=1 Tax=Streptococcus hyovaginalis TaxID=149015 RepID=UPI002A7BE4A9|nr:YihY/virulence factor BrkB family protein [Streptococcus hyovaginalis]MDY3024007.1 YihY/virulence factor BrkB family protein [Streptococcus hyovaginalis]MDY4510777.1 YihY/virulence factor BrkB family protein [Streptococcus hyovaginalis]
MKKLISKIQNSEFVTSFLELFKSAEMDLSSIAVAYYLLITIFPFFVLIANLFPYININTNQILSFLQDNLPKELYSTTADIVISIFNNPNTGLVWISVVTSLWTMSRSMTFLQKSINKAYGVQDHRGIVLGYLFGFLSSIVVVFFLAVAILLSTFGKAVLQLIYNNFPFDRQLYNLLLNLAQPVTALVFVVALGILYYILPNVHIRKIKYILPGTFFTAFVFMTMTSLFGRYVTGTMARLENLRIFGSLAILALMLWFTVFAKVIIFGAILNASYQKKYMDEFETRDGNVINLIKSTLTNEDKEKTS